MDEVREGGHEGRGRCDEWSSEDIEELREVLSVIRREIPDLLKGLIEPVREFMDLTYNPERAKERARAIAAFYRELIDQGIPEDLALKLTREYFVNPMSIVKAMMRGEE